MANSAVNEPDFASELIAMAEAWVKAADYLEQDQTPPDAPSSHRAGAAHSLT
jgi:hypothetical protein